MLTEQHVKSVFRLEQRGLEVWHADGDRGTPWGKIMAFDTGMGVPSVLASHPEMGRSPVLTNMLSGLMETGAGTSAMFMVYCGLTLLPDGADEGIWNSQEQLHDMFLSGSEKVAKIGKGLHVLGADETGMLKIAVRRYETGHGEVQWGKSLYADCPKDNLQFDMNVAGFADGLMSNVKTWEKFRSELRPEQRSDEDALQTNRFLTLIQGLLQSDCKVQVRRREWMLHLESHLEEMGVQFVG
jgi:hypothetical protein